LSRLIYKTSLLVHTLREEVLDFLIALGLNLIFVALVALLLWPLGKAALALRLTKGYGILWVVTALTGVALYRVQRFFRVDTDTHYDALVISNLSHAVFLLAGWSAFAALTVRDIASGAQVWVAAILWLVGLLSSHVAFIVLSSFYPGQVYKLINLILALTSFLVFALWPASGRAVYGWFFNLF
jgi:hypothetical protein